MFNRYNRPGNLLRPSFETDPIVLVRRERQVDFGKNTQEYKKYTERIPKDRRTSGCPTTPAITQKCSRRSFDGQIRLWRILLHAWENADERSVHNENDQSPPPPPPPTQNPVELEWSPWNSNQFLVLGNMN